MALTLIAQPAEMLLARNPVVLQLRAAQSGGDLYSAMGGSATLSALPADRFATGITVTVDFEDPDGNTQSITFTAANDYDETADELPDSTWVVTDGEYWPEVARIIGGHPRIAPFFTVIATGSIDIFIQSKSTQSGWSVSLSNSGGFSVSTAPATADATPVNYRVLVEVFFEGTYRTGNFEMVAQLEGLPNTDTGYLYFDLSDILSAQCRANRTEPLVPVFGINTPFIADNLRRYYIRYTEEYGAPLEVQAWAYTAVKYCMDGGVSQAVHAETADLGYLSEKGSTDAFLTWMADGKTIGEEQPEYLTWYNANSTKTIILEVIRYDVDTGAAKSSLFAYEQEVRKYESAVIPIGVDILQDATTTFGTDTYKMSVRVVDATSDYEGGDPTYLSESRTYYIDRQYYESTRYIQYLNNFGTPETWRCTGELSKRLQVQRLSATIPLQPGYNTLATDEFQYGKTFNSVLIYRTGFVRRADAEILQEMMIEGNVYDVSEDGYIPLRITDTRYNVTSTLEDLHAYQFETQPRLTYRNFSKKQLSGAASDAWLEPGGAFWFDALLVPWQEA